jgi:DNA-binding beta-propeller fold protein YncE
LRGLSPSFAITAAGLVAVFGTLAIPTIAKRRATLEASLYGLRWVLMAVGAFATWAVQVVQLVLTGARIRTRRAALKVGCIAVLMLTHTAWAARHSPAKMVDNAPPDILMDGGRRLIYERSFSSERDTRQKRSFWTKLVDAVAGEPEFHSLVRPYEIAMDSHGRLIVTDPGASGVHIFDFTRQKYKFLQRNEGKDPLRDPQCVAVDAQDNIYLTDSSSGKIFVFNSNGKFQHALGSLKGGEGYFKRPTGIAVDSAADRIYVTDTLRNKVFMLDLRGNVLQTIGKNGTENGEFNFPTELLLAGENLAVVDAMNFRVQVLNRSGLYQYGIGKLGDTIGTMFRPKGLGFDSENHLYVLDGSQSIVQVFNREGQLLYYFGNRGTGAGEFQLPTGLLVDRSDHIYVVDSYNRRVQVFRYFGLPTQAGGRQ